MSTQSSKADEIRDEIQKNPCRSASDLAEEYGVSPATVGRVVRHLDEDLKQMRELRLKRHIDDLYDIEYDILWIVAHQPDAGQAGVKGAYEKHADISGLTGGHPETGTDAPGTVGDVWRDCLDSGWQGRTAVANDLQDLLDEDEVSEAAKEAVATLEAGDIDASSRPASKAEEGSVRYMRYEIAEAVGVDDAERFVKRSNCDLRLGTLKSVGDVLGVGYDDATGRRKISEKIAAEVGHPDVEFVNKSGTFRKPVLKDIRDEVLDAVEEGEDETDDESEGGEEGYECGVCGDEFDGPRGLGGHKPCSDRDGELSSTQIDILGAVQDDPDAYQYEIADAVGTTQSQVSKTFERLTYDWDEREQAAEDLLDQEASKDEQSEEKAPDEPAEGEDTGQEDQEDNESDDVEMQETPSDRDIEQADEAAEEALDEEDEETPSVKNESETNVDAPLLVDEDNVIGIGRVRHDDDSAEIRVEAEKLKQALDLAGQDKVVLRVADDYPLLITGERGSNLGVGVAPRIEGEDGGEE